MSCGLVIIRNVETGYVLCHRGRVAATFRSRLVGLLGTRDFETLDGLLIRPSSAVHTLGMAYAIDVLALDRQHTIIGMCALLVPQRVAFFPRSSREVLELPAGQIGRAALSLGDRLSIEPASSCGV